LAGTVAWMLRPGVTGIGVDLGLPARGFVDFDHMPRDPARWPALGTVTTFIIWWIDEWPRPEIRLVPADPRYRREDFATWIQQQASPAAAAFRERHPSGSGGTEASIEHPWLGTVRRHGDGQLIASIGIPPAIRPARASGDASAEVLIEGAGATADLPALADDAASRVQAALAALDDIKDYAAEHAPGLLAGNRLPAPASLRDALFLEGFAISAAGTEIAFDYGALDMIVVRADPGGQCHCVVLCP
jgi:hypothetical protein